MENRWRKLMSISHNQHNTESHSPDLWLPPRHEQNGFSHFAATRRRRRRRRIPFTIRQHPSTLGSGDGFKLGETEEGNVTQHNQSEQKSQMETALTPCWLDVQQQQWKPQRNDHWKQREGRRVAPLLPKVLLTGCGVCSSLVPWHIFPRSLRSMTIDSLLITWLVFFFF